MSTRYFWNSITESAELDGAWVVMNVEGYTISTLSDVGGFIWSKLQQPVSVEELVWEVLQEYEVEQPQAEHDVDAFLAKLMEHGLLEQSIR